MRAGWEDECRTDALVVTIAFSLLYSLFFFMPLCATLGPEGELHTAREQLVLCGRRLQGKSLPPTPGAQAGGGDKEMAKAGGAGSASGASPEA